MSLKTVFQVKKLSGWDTTEVRDIQRGQEFRILVDEVPIIKEDGTQEFTAALDAFLDDEQVWRVTVL